MASVNKCYDDDDDDDDDDADVYWPFCTVIGG